jgi:hypothetical protein
MSTWKPPDTADSSTGTLNTSISGMVTGTKLLYHLLETLSLEWVVLGKSTLKQSGE